MTKMNTDIDRKPDAISIWEADLLSRKEDADQLQRYIESLTQRPSQREDKRSFTIAVDAPYGEGKTFFLRRFAQQLEGIHPVAFVDAWADDLGDEPLTALASTLKDALAPFLKDGEVQPQFDTFMTKTGAVAKIVGKGLLRRGAGLALGMGAVEGVEAVWSGASESVGDALEDLGKGIASDAEEASSRSLMEKRVADFEEGQMAIKSMKSSLEAIVNALEETALSAPIVIIIDELDRCRPTYAIKLLEEIKHLFDVAGLVFVLGMHGEQLGHSVSGAYGSAFDGRAYLRRFVDREYRLAEPHLEQLLKYLLAGLELERSFEWPMTVIPEKEEVRFELAKLLAEYMHIYGLGPRDAFRLVDLLQTSVALANNQRLYAAYFLPLAIGYLTNAPKGQLPEPIRPSKYAYVPNFTRLAAADHTEMRFPELAQAIQDELGKGWAYYHERHEAGDNSYAVRIGRNDDGINRDEIVDGTPSSYATLLQKVGRFSNPKSTVNDTHSSN